MPSDGRLAAVEDTLTIAEPAGMCGSAARVVRTAVIRLSSKERCQSSSLSSSSSRISVPPTLLTRPSMRPNRSTAAATSLAAASRCVRSRATCSSPGPSPRRPEETTCAPSDRRRCATSRPMPPVDPVTTQTLPASTSSTARYGSGPMTTLLLARHGETDWNRERRWQGWADPPLNDAGRAQARALAEQLRHMSFDAVYSSDLRRAHETAEIVAAPHRVPVFVDARLREIDVGSWSGLTRAEIEARFPGGVRPDGETREQHAKRVLAAVEDIARSNLGRRILVVTHGGTLRALHDVISDLPYHPYANCAVLEVHFRDDRLTAPIG